MGTTRGFIREVIGLGRRFVAQVVTLGAIAFLTLSMASCAKPVQPTELISEPTPQPNRLAGQIAEVSPPETLESLKQIIDAYTPQVRILSPRPGEVLDDTAVTVRLQVRGLPLFKDDTYQLGPHLHLFLDNAPYKAVYDLSEPITFEDLSPGTHTLRVFASRPWHESFKNQGAFDQRTFHVVAPTPQNELNAKAPLLTYSRPQSTYGAEPIMLDFYLTNAPLHMSAQAEDSDDLHDWRIRCTVNDQSFAFDQWQPIWLKGFKPGRNWVQLELIDESGNPIDNRFNNTVRIIDYQPGGSDTLSRLVRGELGLKDVAGIIDPTYVPPAPPASEPEPEPEPTDQAEAAEASPTDASAPDQNAGESEAAQPEPSPQPDSAEEPPQAEPTESPTDTPTPVEPEVDRSNPFLLPEKSTAPEVVDEDDEATTEDSGPGEDAPVPPVPEATDQQEDAPQTTPAPEDLESEDSAPRDLANPEVDAPEDATPELPRVGPEVVEPYTTAPALTEPRASEAAPKESSDQGSLDTEKVPSSDSEAEPEAPAEQTPSAPRSPTVPEARPFI